VFLIVKVSVTNFPSGFGISNKGGSNSITGALAVSMGIVVFAAVSLFRLTLEHEQIIRKNINNKIVFILI